MNSKLFKSTLGSLIAVGTAMIPVGIYYFALGDYERGIAYINASFFSYTLGLAIGKSALCETRSGLEERLE